MHNKIILLTGGGKTSLFMYNGIKNDFFISSVVVEKKVNRQKFLKRRIKKLGISKVFGQVLFQLFIPKFLELVSQNRILDIEKNYTLDSTLIPQSKIKTVQSINSKECIEYLKKENPDLIIVSGTRIISKNVLDCINATFINTHVGITPKYRGVHGGYWALINQDKENCGVTVHLVDTGIDTGGVLFQQNISPARNDNFVTYTYLQIGEGIKLVKKAISDFTNNQLKVKESQTTESNLWYHPTLFFYLKNRLTKGVK